MSEIEFHVEELRDGRFVGQSPDGEIRVESDSLDELPAKVREAVTRHFVDPARRPATVQICFMLDSAVASVCKLELSQS